MKLSRRVLRRGGLLLGTVALGATLGALAAVKYVTSSRLDIVEKKRAVAKIVVTVDRNTAVNVLGKEGRWYKVEVGGKQGYAAETVLSDSPVAAKGKSVSLAAVKGGSVPELETAAAVKGLGDGAKAYASASGLRTSGVEELIRRREAITPAEFDQFTGAGGLAQGPGVAPIPTAAAVASTK